MKTILFTNARDEDNIIEWVNHHLNLGFSHIYIIDHKSIVPVSNIFKNNPSLTIVRLNTDIIKIELMRKAYQIAQNQRFDWMLYLDCDEFLILNNDNHLNTFLYKYKGYDQLAINWLMFVSNNLENIDKNRGIRETYTKCEGKLNQHIKCFINFNNKKNLITIPNPHVFLFNRQHGNICIISASAG